MPCPQPLPLDTAPPRESRERRGTEVPGYTGYVPRKKPGNVFGATFKSANDHAAKGAKTEPRSASSFINKRTTHKSWQDKKELPGQEIPGYAGHIPRKGPENVYGKSYAAANEDATLGRHEFRQDRMLPKSEYPRGREHVGEIPSNIDHVPRKGRTFIRNPETDYVSAGTYGKRHEGARYFYGEGGTPKAIVPRSTLPEDVDLKRTPTGSTRSASSRASRSPTPQRRPSAPPSEAPSEEIWLSPSPTKSRDDGIAARNDLGHSAPWPPRGVSPIARTAQKGRYGAVPRTLDDAAGGGETARSCSPSIFRGETYRSLTSVNSERSLSPGREIPGYSGHIPRKANVYGTTFKMANDRAAVRPSNDSDAAGPTSRRSTQPQPGSGQDDSAPMYSPVLGQRSFSADTRRPAPLGREASGEIPSHIDHVPRKGSRGGNNKDMSLTSSRSENRPAPLGRESIGMIPSHIDHVPRKRRTVEVTTSSPPSMKSRSLSPEFDRIPGYTGHVPRKEPENIFGATFRAANDQAAEGPDASPTSPHRILPQNDRLSPSDTIPGYGGYIAKKGPGNVFGATFRASNERAAGTSADPVASSRTESHRFMQEPLHATTRSVSPYRTPNRSASGFRTVATANAD